jgi:SAM-dependent methyltransferase
MSGKVLFVPSVSKGNGSGHLVRCLALARALGSGPAVFIAERRDGSTWTAAALSIAYTRELAGLRLLSDPAADMSFDLVVLDRRGSTVEEVAFWERIAPVVALDEGGPGRGCASYLVDILPRHPAGGRQAGGFDGANRSSLGFLDLPVNRREPPREFRRVLVSFGGEDPAGLGLALSRCLLSERLFQPGEITIVSGALRKGAPPLGLDGVTVLGPVQDLKEHLARYDLVFSQFGLTAYEAAFAGCGVILLNPSAYHQGLARNAGFPEIGVIEPDVKALRAFVANPAETLSKTSAVAPEERESLAALIGALEPSGPSRCPRCSGPARQALYRNPDKSYFRCASCGLAYLERFSPGRESPYTKSYFVDEYRAQYGRTYLEDWPALVGLAEGRLAIVEKLAGRSLGRSKGLAMLDVGCAYGPYLKAALDRGQEPYGLDVAEDAARYIRTVLGIPAASGDFVDPAVAAAFGGPFDVVSMWYVIEHFVDVDRALRNAAALLRVGGILALSTPSGEGVSARFDRKGFFDRSPADHFTIWEPSRVRGILKDYGFRVENIRVTGHHPERFPFMRDRRGRPRGGLAFAALRLLSRLSGLGDTFEVYAVREPMDAAPESAPVMARRAGRARQH